MLLWCEACLGCQPLEIGGITGSTDGRKSCEQSVRYNNDPVLRKSSRVAEVEVLALRARACVYERERGEEEEKIKVF